MRGERVVKRAPDVVKVFSPVLVFAWSGRERGRRLG